MAARRRVHLATVLLRPPSGHRPDGRQARHFAIKAQIFNIIENAKFLKLQEIQKFENHSFGHTKVHEHLDMSRVLKPRTVF